MGITDSDSETLTLTGPERKEMHDHGSRASVARPLLTLGIRTVHLSSAHPPLSTPYQPFLFHLTCSTRSYGHLVILVLSLSSWLFLKQRCLPSSAAAAAQLQPNQLLPKVRSREPKACFARTFRCYPATSSTPNVRRVWCNLDFFLLTWATQISMHVKKRSWPPFAMNSPLRMHRNS